VNRTKIQWVKNPDGTQGYSLNPLKGLCPMGCEYCYGKGFYTHYKWNPEPRLAEDVLVYAHDELSRTKKPRGIFMCSMFEWLWDEKWAELIYSFCVMHKRHRFYLLTKLPERLSLFSPFPENCYIGATAVDNNGFRRAVVAFSRIEAVLTFVSFEPLLEHIKFADHTYNPMPNIGWAIIGCQTKPIKLPPKGAVEDILDAAGRANIPVFIKPPLSDIMNYHREEMPRDEKGARTVSSR